MENKLPLSYVPLVQSLISQRYSIQDELAIMRQQAKKPEEYDAYFAYCEECKQKAKEIIENQ
jgi:hypothetical protein